MKIRGWFAMALGLAVGSSAESWGQPAATAKIEVVPLELKSPERYQVPAVLEPIRHVALAVPVDGILRSFDTTVGATVREHQEIGQLDRAEASARVKIAKANVKEAQAVLANAPNPSASATAKAQLEAAEARAEIAELELERFTLRAPFAGRLLEVSVSPGQFLPKGTKIGELADVSSLRVQVPLERSAASVGASVSLLVEGQPVMGKIQASLPLPEGFSALRELAAAFTASWVVLPNPKGDLEPGQRVLSPALPTSPIATIPSRALHEPKRGDTAGTTIQVIRNEYVVDVHVRVLGRTGPERTQITAPLRPHDGLIVSSSLPLLAGTLIRFTGSSSGAIEGTNPNPSVGGELAGITPPRGGAKPAAGPASGTDRTPTTRPAAPTPARNAGAPF
jgi:multidrug efflux pump subunit AcrA (membrane-fusion protein)